MEKIVYRKQKKRRLTLNFLQKEGNNWRRTQMLQVVLLQRDAVWSELLATNLKVLNLSFNRLEVTSIIHLHICLQRKAHLVCPQKVPTTSMC
jgi:hypothetical protein